MKATGLNHVSITAPDLEASIRFYTQVFGMEELPAPKFAGQAVAWLRLGDQQLHLMSATARLSFTTSASTWTTSRPPTSGCVSSRSAMPRRS